MDIGVRTNNLTYRPAIAKELLVNGDQGTGLLTVDDLSTQLVGSGPISTAIAGAVSGVVTGNSLADINAKAAQQVMFPGRGGEVPTGADQGLYSWSGTTFIRTGDYIDTNAVNALQALFQDWKVTQGTYVEGQYVNRVTGIAIADGNYRIFRYVIASGDLAFRATGVVAGSAVALAVFVNANTNTVLGFQYPGADAVTTPYNQASLTIPAGTTDIYLTTRVRTKVFLEVARTLKTLPADVSAAANAVSLTSQRVEDGSAWETAFPATATDGQLVDKDTGMAAANASWKLLSYKISPLDLELRATGLVAAPVTALATFIDAVGAIPLGFQNGAPSSGSQPYTEQPLVIPAGTTDVILCGLVGSPLALEVRRAPNNSGYWERPSQTLQAGYITDRTTGVISANPSWTTVEIPLTGKEKGLRASATVAATSTALATFKDQNGAVIKSEYNASDVAVKLVNARLNMPANARSVAICGLRSTLVEIQVLKNHSNLAQRIGAPALSRAYEKTAVEFGTSIPAGGPVAGSYAQRGADMIGIRLYNEAVGYSMIRRGFKSRETASDPYGWTGAPWQNIAYSLGQTLTEKNELITNWQSKWSGLLTGSDKPTTLDAATQAFWRDCSFENRLVARHLGGLRRSVYLLSHGHNDRDPNDLAGLSTIPADFFDRGTFIGACNFFIDKILSDDPRARILIEGHYEVARKVEVSQAQIALANIWNVPLLRLWDKLGWSQRSVTSGGVTKTITQWRMTDDLHPHSTEDGSANDLIAPHWARFVSENM